MGKLITLKTDGTVLVEDNVESIGLGRLHEGVGGYIETVPYFNTYKGEPCFAFCDEEGKLKGKAVNANATRLWYDILGRVVGDFLVGDILIVQGEDLINQL